MQESPNRQDLRTNAEDSDYGRAWGASRVPQMMLSVRFANGNRRFFAYTDSRVGITGRCDPAVFTMPR